MSAQTRSQEPRWAKSSASHGGISCLGDFMVAASVLEFSADHSKIEEALRVRFQEADVIDGQDRLSGLVENVTGAIEDPGFDPGVPLDLRGTPYQVRVWPMLREIPVGEVDELRRCGSQAGHARRSRGNRGDRRQSHCGPGAVPWRHQEGRLDLRLPLGFQAQARAAGARTTL